LDSGVDASDLAVLLASWNSFSETADLNDDVIVDASDLAVLLSNWGSCP
jgi:hypothetical protein